MNDDPKNDARYQRGFVPDAAASDLTAFLSPASDNQPAASADSTEIGLEPAPDAAELLDQFEPRNPFIIALWAIGPALIVGGLILQVRNFLASFAGSGYINRVDSEIPFELLMTQFAWFLGPAMTSTGLATVVGLLFLHALRWRSGSTRR